MNRRIDHWLILIVLILSVGGMLMVFSASAVGNPSSVGAEFKYLQRQMIAFGVGSVLCIIAALTPIEKIRAWHKIFYYLCLFGLLLCFAPIVGHPSHGANRWIGFGSVNVQPSAFAKIAVLISLAHYLREWRGQLHQIPVLLKSLAIPGVMVSFIIIEPDFGTTLIISTLCFFMLVTAGMKKSHILKLMSVLLVLGTIVLFSADYRRRRLFNFLDPWSVRTGEGYQIIQSWIALHEGGFWGKGLGNSVSKRQFLPEPWTDFIAAVIGEELGFIGILAIILLFAGFLWRGFYIASKAKDAFSMYLATALTLMIVGEAGFNLGVVMGVVPPKGLVLPFISYGASAMMANMLAVGLLLSISSERKEVPLEKGWREPRSKNNPDEVLEKTNEVIDITDPIVQEDLDDLDEVDDPFEADVMPADNTLRSEKDSNVPR
jgi:cell division protein FtsW